MFYQTKRLYSFQPIIIYCHLIENSSVQSDHKVPATNHLSIKHSLALSFSFHSEEKRYLCFQLSISMAFFYLLSIISCWLLCVRANLLFKTIDPELRTIARNNSCSPNILRTISPLDRVSCALECGFNTRCRAFIHSQPNRCELLSSPWQAPAKVAGQTLMMLPLQDPTSMTWRFEDSEYILTKEKRSFSEMKSVCAAKGMHLWYPDSTAELRFIEREVLCNLPKEYYFEPDWFGYRKTVIFNVWFGVIDRPNNNCLLADERTKCPVKIFHKDEPSGDNDECIGYWWRDGSFSWDDFLCGDNHHHRVALCEKDL